MKKKFIIYKQNDKLKKAVLDENMYRAYSSNPDISIIEDFDSEMLMEKNFASLVTDNKKILFG